MKFLIFALGFIACVYADVSELGYGYQQPAASAPAPVEAENSYLPPSAPAPLPEPINSYVPPAPAPEPVAPVNTYIPPAPAPEPVAPVNTYIPPAPAPEPVAPVNTYIPPAPAPAPVATAVEEPNSSYLGPEPVAHGQPIAPIEEIEQIPEDGYHYQTVRRVVYRHRN